MKLPSHLDKLSLTAQLEVIKIKERLEQETNLDLLRNLLLNSLVDQRIIQQELGRLIIQSSKDMPTPEQIRALLEQKNNEAQA